MDLVESLLNMGQKMDEKQDAPVVEISRRGGGVSWSSGRLSGIAPSYAEAAWAAGRALGVDAIHTKTLGDAAR